MKTLYSLPTALMLGVILFISGCGKGDDNDPDVLQCGGDATWESTTVFSNLIYNDLDIVTGNRIFIYEDITTPENICIDQSVVVYYTVHHKPGIFDVGGITMTGKAYFGQSGEDETQMTYDALINRSDSPIQILDLTSQFSTNPGWVGLQVKFAFPTQGSFSADSIYLHTYVQSILISCNYKVAP